jgi:hypothetical protein
LRTAPGAVARNCGLLSTIFGCGVNDEWTNSRWIEFQSH